MKVKKFLMIAACSVTVLLAGCGAQEDTDPDAALRSSSGNMENENGDVTPAPDKAALLSMDEVTRIARSDAKVAEDELENLHARLNEEDGKKEYTVIFATADKTYQYLIAASDGMILEKNVNLIDRGSDTQLSAAGEIQANTPDTTTADISNTSANETSTPPPTQAPSLVSAEITQDAALEIARNDAGVSESEIFNLQIKLDFEDGVRVYEIDFDAGTMEYEYEIAVSDGRIVSRKSEPADHLLTTAPKATATPIPTTAPKTTVTPVPTTAPEATAAPQTDPTQAPSPQTTEITQDAAMEIAWKDAGVSESEMLHLKAKLEFDDGIRVYEIEFDTADKEYEYKIDALSGAILEKEVDAADFPPSDTGSSPQTREISEAEALAIVRADTNISEADMLDLEIKIDSDDGIRYYEFEFCCDGYEYEYEVCASDGRILKRDCDSCDHSWHHSDWHHSDRHHSDHH